MPKNIKRRSIQRTKSEFGFLFSCILANTDNVGSLCVYNDYREITKVRATEIMRKILVMVIMDAIEILQVHCNDSLELGI